MNKISSTILVGIVILLVVGCSQTNQPKAISLSPVRTATARDFSVLKINEIVVLPFEVDKRAEIDADLVNRFSKSLESAFELGTSLQVANTRLNKKLSEALSQTSVGKVPLSGKALSGKDRAIEIGRRLGIQGVLHGVVTSYYDPERNGHDANVGFILWLVEPRTGRTVWEASFDHHNQPLTDNLLRLSDRLQEGIAYQRAEALFEYGLKESAKTYEAYRNKNNVTVHVGN